MMNYLPLIFLFFSAFFTGCTLNVQETAGAFDDAEETVILVSGGEKSFSKTECIVSDTQGGTPQYSLRISFINESNDKFNKLFFSVQDAKNNKDNLLTAGIHPATGNHWDEIHNMLSPSSFTSNYLTAEEMEITWNVIEVSNREFRGKGCINIKKKITAPLGDGFYPSQKIYFSCESGEIV